MNKKGFSLLELMIVIAIVGILMGVVIPSMKSMIIQAKIKNKADAVVAVLQLARTEALKRNTSMTVQFEPGTISNSSTSGMTIGCTATVFNAATARVLSACPGSRFVSAAQSYGAGASSIYTYPPEDGMIGRSDSLYRMKFDQVSTIPTVSFDSNGNFISTNPDGSASVARVMIYPNATGSSCKSVSNVKGTFNECEVDIVIAPSGGIRICYPSIVYSSSNPMGC